MIVISISLVIITWYNKLKKDIKNVAINLSQLIPHQLTVQRCIFICSQSRISMSKGLVIIGYLGNRLKSSQHSEKSLLASQKINN